MRIALLYPPPWKIPARGEAPLEPEQGGPPLDYREGDLDADFFQTPFGLFSLGAQALRAGHQVKVLNLSGFAFSALEEVISKLDADLYGMSCWTANRRGVAQTAELIKRYHPDSTVVIGGPHATPFAKEMLEHHADIDLVCVGESDDTFLELIERRRDELPLTGVAGTVFRSASGIEHGPPRASIPNLDALASPHQYFDTHIVMTSRGCPWACTFCGAETSWGRGFRGHSVPYVLDALERLIPRLRVKMVQVKDDTFTTNKKRVIELCRGIRERKLNFLWSCDTRVDVLSEELLYEMRLAGCQRLSLGVESGSQRILEQIHKKITKEAIIRAADMAKKYGVHVRFYMMLGNRGETAESFRETLDFLDTAKPHQYIFSCLSIYPGTEDFRDAEAAGWLDRELYFTGDFQELKVPFDAPDDVARLMSDWFSKNNGLREHYLEGVEECRSILERLPNHHAAHLDLGAAYLREGELDLAEMHVRRAIELGFPAPGLAYNYLAVIAYRRGDIKGMQDEFMVAAKTDPQHHVLIQNVEAARAWFRERGPETGRPLSLIARHDFQLFERTQQPTLPGALPDDVYLWQEPVRGTEESSLPEASAMLRIDTGNESLPFRAKRLPVLGR
ncbi:MAG TPA: radical SAM protein [Polyangiaceae bacterium]|nr:radical SAM protein [Polyangiaceae bacterium]